MNKHTCVSLTPTGFQVAYAVWRFFMWSGNYGTYEEIDAAVADGKLTPGEFPPGYGPGPEAEISISVVNK
jgi:hypothetical protein